MPEGGTPGNCMEVTCLPAHTMDLGCQAHIKCKLPFPACLRHIGPVPGAQSPLCPHASPVETQGSCEASSTHSPAGQSLLLQQRPGMGHTTYSAAWCSAPRLLRGAGSLHIISLRSYKRAHSRASDSGAQKSVTLNKKILPHSAQVLFREALTPRGL